MFLFSRENVTGLGFDPGSIQLTTLSELTVASTAIDGEGVTITVGGYSARPSAVLRGGNSVPETCVAGALTPTWCYDALAGTVSLNEVDSALSVWTIQP